MFKDSSETSDHIENNLESLEKVQRQVKTNQGSVEIIKDWSEIVKHSLEIGKAFQTFVASAYYTFCIKGSGLELS